MKSVVEQLSNYKSVHLNKNNIKTHFLGIPMIIWAIAVLLNMNVFQFDFNGNTYNIGFAVILAVLVWCYYLVLHRPLAIMVLLIFGPLIYSTNLVAEHPQVMAIAIATFVVGWILQFIGHAYEKAKPAFVDDLNQLLIGPLFLIAEVYFALGLNNNMDKEVHEQAVAKRQSFEQAKAKS